MTHALRGNRVGAAALLRRGRERIAPYAARPPHGIDVRGLSSWAHDSALGQDRLDPEVPSVPRLRRDVPADR
jgi:hypothetical protein